MRAAGRQVRAEENRDAEAGDDGKKRAQDAVGVSSGAVAAAEDVAEVRLQHDACGFISGRTRQLAGEPFPGAPVCCEAPRRKQG